MEAEVRSKVKDVSASPDGAGISARVRGMGGSCLFCALKRGREGLFEEDCQAFCKHPPDWKDSGLYECTW